jgi:DNA-binding CsgD family transcriptional regulator
VPFVAAGDLLERERELETLRAGLDRARVGDGTLLLIEGPAGAGKTALAHAAAKQAPMVSLQASGSELERPFAFGVVRQLLEPVVSHEPEGGELFAGGAGPAARLFAGGDGWPGGADVGFEALHSLYWLIVNIADRAPTIVLVDDWQWADRDSLRFLAYLAQRIEGLPVAMLLTGRPDAAPDEGAALWAQVASRPAAIVLRPRPLSADAVTELVARRLAAEPAEEFCRACHAATGGNPLFLRELLRALAGERVAPSAAAASEVRAVGPAAVSRFVLHRIAALGPAATELARAVAVLGDDIDPPLAARMSGLPEDAARKVADDLVRADIFVRSDRFGFEHPIVRAALYEDLAPGERQARHAMAADALAADGAAAERVSAHLLLTPPTGDQRRVATLRSAATGAARRGAPRAAAECLRRALAEAGAAAAATAAGRPGHQRAAILTELGWYEIATMQFAAAEEHLRAALAAAPDLATSAEAASLLGRCAIVSGGRSAQAASDAMSALAQRLWPTDQDRSLELTAGLLMVATTVPALRPRLGADLRRFRELARGHPRFAAVARIHSATEQFTSGAPAGPAMDDIETALAASLPRNAENNVVLLALRMLRHGERYEPASRLLDAALDRTRREGHATRLGIVHGLRAEVALARGALPDAQVEAETGLLLVTEPHFAVLQLLAVAIVVHIERGALDAAQELACRGDAIGIHEDHSHAGDFLLARGRLRLAQGQLDEGVADLLGCGQRLEAHGVRWPSEWRALAAPALASLGDRQQAEKLAREHLAAARKVGLPGGIGVALHAAGLAIGNDEGLELLREAVSVLRRSAARLELAHTLADLGTALNGAGHRAQGRDAQRAAIKLAGQCGALALEESAMAALQAGPGRRARLELTGPGALTAAEWRVCRQAAEGLTNREAAQALFVTEKTIERHLSSAYTKLGIRSRVQLATALQLP